MSIDIQLSFATYTEAAEAMLKLSKPLGDMTVTTLPEVQAKTPRGRKAAENAQAATGDSRNISTTPEDRKDPEQPADDGSAAADALIAEQVAKGAQEPKTEEAKPADEPKPTLTKQNVQEAFAKVIKKIGQDSTRAFLVELGYQRIGDIPEDKYAEVVEKAEEKVAA